MDGSDIGETERIIDKVPICGEGKLQGRFDRWNVQVDYSVVYWANYQRVVYKISKSIKQ